MNTPSITTPKMGELKVSNALLGDRAALAAAWEQDGYWFFRDVLDKEAVAQLRTIYLDVLKNLGVVDRDAHEAIYNGASLEGYPMRMEPLVAMRPWKPFVAQPAIHDFFKRLLGDEPFWIPTPEYRATPPNQDRSRNRFDWIHQDGFYNQGIPFRICWIPLAEIDEEIGGVVFAEGLHNGPCLHDRSAPPLFPIPPGAIPDDAWRRTTYRPGDVLLMDINTPHSGLANYAYRHFRLSLDIRVMGASGNVPMIGQIFAVESRSITVRADDGRTRSFTFDEETYCRGLDGKKVPLAEIASRLKQGDEVIVASEDGRAKVIRPPH